MIPDEGLIEGQTVYKTNDTTWEVGLIADAGWTPAAGDTYA